MKDRRLIEAAFPLKQVSLDSVHEKNVRHGHISTLHIWPARRPLAASRAAILATLLPDPGTPGERRELLRRMAGTVVEVPDRSGQRIREETRGGILHWGRESDVGGLSGTPGKGGGVRGATRSGDAGGSGQGRIAAASDALGGAGVSGAGSESGQSGAHLGIAAFRREILEAFGGRAPRVLDPFAGGGAIPLEAMRLGCEVVASDLNPVAWFILRCTLHYPRLLAGRKLPLPDFAVRDREFMSAYLKAQGYRSRQALREALAAYGHHDREPLQFQAPAVSYPASGNGADIAWHLRAWGRRVLGRARRRLAQRYPTYAEFEPVRRKRRSGKSAPGHPEKRFRPRPPRLLTPDENGEVSVAPLNAEFDSLYLENEANPRWVAKPTVAYLWARTVKCSGCRQEVPLLKTRWLCRTGRKRVVLTMAAGEGGVTFGLYADAPADADGVGTMSASGATCPCCGVISTMADLRAAGKSGRLGARMTAVVVDGQQGKEYRLPTDEEIGAAGVGEEDLESLFANIPYGLPEEPTPSEQSLGMRIPRYGIDSWRKLFTNRQLLALGTFIREIRALPNDIESIADDGASYPQEWIEALVAYLAPVISRLTDRGSCLATWTNNPEKIRSTFARFALPMVWDFAESCPLSDTSGGFIQAIEWMARTLEHLNVAVHAAPMPYVSHQSAAASLQGPFDLICTDPPYYDAIPYSDLMDFFHLWLRRVLHGLSQETDAAFASPLGPKWSVEENDGELIDDASRFMGDRPASKRNYEDGMARAFARFHEALEDNGRLVIVFANKSPDAWETLVSALIRTGFVVDGSWPIQTERLSRQRSLSSAALASSIWLICKKRLPTARPGWDRLVLEDMRQNINGRLREFWDAGIRGPDFVWAATGPALEAFSKHPVVKKTDIPGEQLTVAEFLRQVRRIVVGFVVNRLFREEGDAADELDDPTTYYLLHRNDFGLEAAPAGACILYALSCNLSDSDLARRHDLLARGGARAASGDTATEDAGPGAKGSEARLKPWDRRRARDLGEPSMDGTAPPLIDCAHKLMRLWKTGEQSRVDAYLEGRGLWDNELFSRVVQALIELSEAGSEERAVLEYIQNHLAARGGAPAPQQRTML